MRRRGKRRVSEWSDCVHVSVSEEAWEEKEKEKEKEGMHSKREPTHRRVVGNYPYEVPTTCKS